MLDSALLEILCCPETHQSLQLAEPSLVASLNQQIAAKSMLNRAGKSVDQPIEGGLLRDDGKFLYLIRNGIPVLLIDEALPVTKG